MKIPFVVGVILIGATFCDGASTSTQPTPAKISSASIAPTTTTSEAPTSVAPTTNTAQTASTESTSSSNNPGTTMPNTSEMPSSGATGSSNNPTTNSGTTGPSTSPIVQPTPAPKSGFDGASFGGGIALGLGICIIILVVYKVYSSRRSVDYNKVFNVFGHAPCINYQRVKHINYAACFDHKRFESNATSFNYKRFKYNCEPFRIIWDTHYFKPDNHNNKSRSNTQT